MDALFPSFLLLIGNVRTMCNYLVRIASFCFHHINRETNGYLINKIKK